MEATNKHKPFKNTGDDFSTSNPIFAYFFYKYYIAMIVPIYQETKQSDIELEIKEVNKLMTKISTDNKIGQSDQENMRSMLEYTELMFAKNEHYHQQGNISKQIAEDYLTIYRLYEVVGKFGKLDEGQNKRRIYSKKKFIDLMKTLKNNPQLENSNNGSSNSQQGIKNSEHQNMNNSQQGNIKQSNHPAINLPPPVFKEEKKIEVIEEQIKKSHFNPLPKPSKLISFDKVQMQIQASRSLENAVSELSFDRYKYARDELMHALELLDQIIDS